jgi:hypothetical protein
MEWLVAAAAALAAGFFARMAYGRRRWNRATEYLFRRLEAQRQRIGPARYDALELTGLPAPVQRFFRAVLLDGQAMVVSATFAHHGTFNNRGRQRPMEDLSIVSMCRNASAWLCLGWSHPDVAGHFHLCARRVRRRLRHALRQASRIVHGRGAARRWRRTGTGRADALPRRSGLVSHRAPAQPGRHLGGRGRRIGPGDVV